MITKKRKVDHIRICLEKAVECYRRPFEDLVLIHSALPEISENDIDVSCDFLGQKVRAPLIISAMTGGHPDTKKINVNLAEAAQEMGVALGVGSQRAALEDPKQEDTFSAVREAAPDVPIIGNIGAVQLRKCGPEVLEILAEMIDANAIAIHLNFLQESVQPEGDRDASGIFEALRYAARGTVPLLIKETGAGIGHEIARELVKNGLKLIDVSGMGGTSWSGVEAYRAEEAGDIESMELGKLFWNWGIPTPASIVECLSAGADVVASGGIRSGIDAAKSIALGASMTGIALPLLSPATKSSDEVVKVLKTYVRALKISMFLTGCRNIHELQCAPLVVLGSTKDWLNQRGFDIKKYSIVRELA
ncbi:MAG: type 2 isopentenyl-diphosphate Delta-isomerase [Methanotrichaceae archaeon]|nr:type 2 isopentenyl-diphosphate Delta-isomerase [Methanotrichaceae archaeon]